MSTKFISIQEAADISQKSIQTIRRAIKAKKLNFKKKKTPQGFNYVIDKSSLEQTYGIKTQKITETKEKNTKISKPAQTTTIDAEDFKKFTGLLEKMVNQHSEERQNYMRLVTNLQEKVFVLENELNVMKTGDKKWYHFWK